ncbi:hypothetical protein SAMN05660293_05539, partial [Dyadobacter psychrophilus]
KPVDAKSKTKKTATPKKEKVEPAAKELIAENKIVVTTAKTKSPKKAKKKTEAQFVIPF